MMGWDKLKTVGISILAGADVVFTMFTPIIIAAILISLTGESFNTYLIFVVSLLATIFRAIKIGWFRWQKKNKK